MSFKKIISIIFAFALLSFGSVKAIDKDSDNDWSDINILFLILTAEDVEFFVPSINGAHDAAEDQGISMYMEFGDSDTAKTNDILETAIASSAVPIANCDPPLNPNQPSHRINTPIVTNGIEDAANGLTGVAPPDFENLPILGPKMLAPANAAAPPVE